MNDPDEVRVSAMRSTNSTDAWPASWMSPFEVPSGRGAVISAEYSIPMGIAAVMKKPSTKAAANNPGSDWASATPTRAGPDASSASTR